MGVRGCRVCAEIQAPCGVCIDTVELEEDACLLSREESSSSMAWYIHLVILESPWRDKGQLGVLPRNVVLVAAIFVILLYRADTYAGGHHFGILPLVY